MNRRLRDILKLDLKEEAALIAIDRLGPIGRGLLAQILDLPEGVVRGLISRMSRLGLIEVTGRGAKITEKGCRRIADALDRRSVREFSILPPGFLGVDMPSIALQVSCGADLVGLGLEERDSALPLGAKALVTVKYTDGRLRIPGVSDNLDLDSKGEASMLRERFKLEEGDLILIAFSDNVWKALTAGLYVADILWRKP